MHLYILTFIASSGNVGVQHLFISLQRDNLRPSISDPFSEQK